MTCAMHWKRRCTITALTYRRRIAESQTNNVFCLAHRCDRVRQTRDVFTDAATSAVAYDQDA